MHTRIHLGDIDFKERRIQIAVCDLCGALHYHAVHLLAEVAQRAAGRLFSPELWRRCPKHLAVEIFHEEFIIIRQIDIGRSLCLNGLFDAHHRLRLFLCGNFFHILRDGLCLLGGLRLVCLCLPVGLRIVILRFFDGIPVVGVLIGHRLIIRLHVIRDLVILGGNTLCLILRLLFVQSLFCLVDRRGFLFIDFRDFRFCRAAARFCRKRQGRAAPERLCRHSERHNGYNEPVSISP